MACVERSASVEHRHLAEQRAGLEHGERFLAAARHVAADADLAVDDQVEPVAVLAFAEDVLAARRTFFFWQTSATCASSSSSRSLKIATFLSSSVTSAMPRLVRGDRAKLRTAVRAGKHSIAALVSSLDALSCHGRRARVFALSRTSSRLHASCWPRAFVAAVNDRCATRARRPCGGAPIFSTDGSRGARNVTSRWGALIDPIADRVFALVAVSTFSVHAACCRSSGFFVMISRDIMTAVGFHRRARSCPGCARCSSRRVSGSSSRVLQFVTFVALLRFPSWVDAVLCGSSGSRRRFDRRLHACALARARTVMRSIAARAARMRRALVVRARLRRRSGTSRTRMPSIASTRSWDVGRRSQGGAWRCRFRWGIYVRFGRRRRRGRDVAMTARHAASGRVDAIARFLLDPFREMPLGLSLGGGVSVPYASGDTATRPYLTAVVDIEGRRRGGLTPALQLGLGGGARVGLVLRTSMLAAGDSRLARTRRQQRKRLRGAEASLSASDFRRPRCRRAFSAAARTARPACGALRSAPRPARDTDPSCTPSFRRTTPA